MNGKAGMKTASSSEHVVEQARSIVSAALAGATNNQATNNENKVMNDWDRTVNLGKELAVIVWRWCGRCESWSDRRLAYDRCIDPLGSGAQLPADFVDDGSDLVLCRRGTRVASIRLRDGGSAEMDVDGGRPSERRDLAKMGDLAEMGVDAGRVLEEGVRRTSEGEPELVLRDAVDGCQGGGRRRCEPLRSLAMRLGLLHEWSSDDVDWSQREPDLMQYVANASTGRVRLFSRWSIPPHHVRAEKEANSVDELWAELARRGRCPRCGHPCDGIGRRSPLCVECAELTAAEEDDARRGGGWPQETVKMDPDEREARNRALRWLRGVKHVKRPSSQSDAHDRGESKIELPCVRCRRTIYKPAFWYGYRSICNRCLAPEFAIHTSDTPPKSSILATASSHHVN